MSKRFTEQDGRINIEQFHAQFAEITQEGYVGVFAGQNIISVTKLSSRAHGPPEYEIEFFDSDNGGPNRHVKLLKDYRIMLANGIVWVESEL